MGAVSVGPAARLLVLGSFLLAAACGGGGDAGDGDAPGEVGNPTATVKSADGAALLLIPDGALPDGVSASDISIVPIGFGDAAGADEAQTVAAYELLPDGLELSSPATLRLELGAAVSGTFVVWHLTEDSAELLPVTLAASGDALEVEVEHFSDLLAADLTDVLKAFIEAKVEVAGGRLHQIKRPFLVTGSTSSRTDERRVDFGTRRGSFSAKIREMRLVEAMVTGSEHLAPRVTRVGAPAAPPNPFEAELTCLEVGAEMVWFTARFELKADYDRLSPAGNFSQREGAVGSVSTTAFEFVTCQAGAVPEPTSGLQPNRPPVVTPIGATVALPTTTYTITATDPDNDALTIGWSGQNCGSAAGTATTSMAWSHGAENCDHTEEHDDVTITVFVTDGFWDVRCHYQGASATGKTSCDEPVESP